METIPFSTREYAELIRIKDRLEKILEEKRESKPAKKSSLLNAFGVLKGSFRGDSLNYISKLREEWRK